MKNSKRMKVSSKLIYLNETYLRSEVIDCVNS